MPNEGDDQIRMKRSTTDSAFGGVLPRFRFLLALLVLAVSGVSIALVTGERIGTPMHSVQLTQKGYIQVRIDHSRVDLCRFATFVDANLLSCHASQK
jgi:hypothetical protein